MVTNMKQWNGKHGCLYCEDEGKTIGRDQLYRYWPYLESARPRSHASLLKNAEKAINTADEYGVKGPTALALHPHFDLASGVVIDDLHGIFLGVTLHLWFDKQNKGMPYFIGN